MGHPIIMLFFFFSFFFHYTYSVTGAIHPFNLTTSSDRTNMYLTCTCLSCKGWDGETLWLNEALSLGEARISGSGLWQIPDPPEGTAQSACPPPAADLRALRPRPGAHFGGG